jgi:hypothetical protein
MISAPFGTGLFDGAADYTQRPGVQVLVLATSSCVISASATASFAVAASISLGATLRR